MRTAWLMALSVVLPSISVAGGVRVDVLRPAEVTVPRSVQRVAVLNRAGPRGDGEVLLVSLLDLVTGEPLDADQLESEDAVAVMRAALDDSPRFKLVSLDGDVDGLEAGLRAHRLERDEVMRLCEDRCDAIVSLERFDVEDDGELIGVPTSSGYAVWRMYRATDGKVMDKQELDTMGFGSDRVVNVFDAMAGEDALGHAEASAAAYVGRIMPTWDVERRKLYSSSVELRYGTVRARAGDWDSALGAWNAVAEASHGRKRAKALYNLAIAHELLGDHASAEALTRRAVQTHETPAIRRLSDQLEQRRRSSARAECQLALAEDG